MIPGWLDEANAAVFYGVIRELRPLTVVEIGSYLGRSTVLLGLALKAYGRPGARLTAIDPHTGDRQQLEKLRLKTLPTYDLFRLHCLGAGIDDIVDAVSTTSDQAAPNWDGLVDLAYIDGWHSYDAVRSDARNWASRLSQSGVVCFDDFGKYEAVRQAVLDACCELGLHLYGDVLDQAWVGRSPAPPPSIGRAIRATKIKNLALRVMSRRWRPKG
jgi:predicted O-methyltransferase YrrM